MSDTDQFAEQPAAPNQQAATPTAAAAADAARPKNIIVCCDGTGNEFAVRNSPDSNSNVVKLYTALRLSKNQFGYYHPGVGTMGDPTKSGWKRQWSRIKGLAFASGFEENVLDAYRYLMQHYNAGDKVFLFGFSRGAYTARALAGLLHGYGLLARGNESHLLYAWRMYTGKLDEKVKNNKRTIETDFSFRDTFSHKDFILHFVGLWDTVSSVGWISTPVRLLHLAENPSIVTGRHAVSIDERRSFYQDNLYGKPVHIQVPAVLRGTQRGRELDKIQDLVQVWFPGVHSDVGGSYPQLENVVSDVSLLWMMGEAFKAGAVFDPARQSAVLGGPVLNDPQGLTANIAALYEKPTIDILHISLKGFWWVVEFFPHRYYDTDDSPESMRIPLGARRTLPPDAIVHPSVKARMKNDIYYRPGNVALKELQKPAVNPQPTQADLTGFFRFTPRVRRTPGLRANWLVVFLVTVLESALGFWLLGGFLRYTYKTAIWLMHLLAHWLHGARPAPDFAYHASSLRFLSARLHDLCSPALCSPQAEATLSSFWPLVVALLVVVTAALRKAMRRFST